jgi:hypothetical protein
MDDRRDGGRDEVRRGMMSGGGGFCASRTCAWFSSSMSRTNFIPQNSMSEHLNLKHARHEATTSPETKAPPMPEIAIQNDSDIVYTYRDILLFLDEVSCEEGF